MDKYIILYIYTLNGRCGVVGALEGAGQAEKGVVGGCVPRASHLSPLLRAKRCFPSEQLRVNAHIIYIYIYIYTKYILLYIIMNI